MSDHLNPYAAPAAASSTATVVETQEVSTTRYYWSIVLCLTCMLGAIIASALAVFDIETILASGPLLLLAATVLMIVARPKPLLGLWAPALSLIVSIIILFLWIFLTGMGPAEAQVPVGRATMGAAFTAQIGWVTMYVVISERRSRTRPDSNTQTTRHNV